ncbi:MAG: hypothetical protein HDT28_01950 [Clostridiales bacterium]|nr:hypothetical protein [Clostridiales bacterium]
MAKQNTSDTERTPAQKCDYYKKRVNDPNLSQAQRNWAQRRINQLCGGGNSAKPSTPPKKSTGPMSGEQLNAQCAGIGYGAAKAGARVNVKPENRDAFRDGVKVGRSLGNKF